MLRAILDRLRGDELKGLEAEIAASRLKIPGQPSKLPALRSLDTVLRDKNVLAVAIVAACLGIYSSGYFRQFTVAIVCSCECPDCWTARS